VTIKTDNRSIVEIKDITAGAGALGLLGYGMPGVLLSLANAGIIQAGSAILGMVIFMGGFAMFTAGLMEWKKGNTYGMAAYGSYGLFWFSFAALLILPIIGLAKDTGGAGAMAAYLSLWGLFTIILFIGSLKMSRALQFRPRDACHRFFPRSRWCSNGDRDVYCPGRICGYHQRSFGNLYRTGARAE
jgi:succinate-acetate transporter protein